MAGVVGILPRVCPAFCSIFGNVTEQSSNKKQGGVLDYHTVKLVQIKDGRLGVVHRAIIGFIVMYLIFYVLVYSKGYAVHESAVGTVTRVVRGTALSTDGSVWDSPEVIIPVEKDALWLTTSYVTQMNQSEGICNGIDPLTEFCDSGRDCLPLGSPTANGISTGECDTNTGRCRIHAWCPPLDTEHPPAILRGVENFTLTMYAYLSFPAFGKRVDNLQDSSREKGVNEFALSEWLTEVGVDLSNDDWKHNGTTIGVFVKWSCDFDKHKRCFPEFTPVRFDRSATNNYGFASVSYIPDGTGGYTRVRNVRRVNGVRIVFIIDAIGYRFDFPTLLISIGSTIAFFVLASVITDIILLTCFPKKHRKHFRQRKYIVIPEYPPKGWMGSFERSLREPLLANTAETELQPYATTL